MGYDEDMTERRDPDYQDPIEWGPPGRLTDSAIAHRQDVRRQQVSTGMGAWADLDHLGGQEATVIVPTIAYSLDDKEMDRDAAEALAATAARALARLDAIEKRYGNDLDDGAVIRFRRIIRMREYHYAAIRAGGYWYVTGERSPQRETWAGLVRWLDSIGVEGIDRMCSADLAQGDGSDDGDEYPKRSL
jgi:hypothetical protein